MTVLGLESHGFRVPAEGDVVAPSPTFLAGINQQSLAFARGRLTLIEHEKGQAYGMVEWDHPGLPDRVALQDLVRAIDFIRPHMVTGR